MKESKGVPRLRLDMLRQLKSALAEGFSKNDKTGSRYISFLMGIYFRIRGINGLAAKMSLGSVERNAVDWGCT